MNNMIPRQTILDGLIAVLGVASLLLLHNPPVPSDESKLWYEVPLCDIGSGELRSHVPLEGVARHKAMLARSITVRASIRLCRCAHLRESRCRAYWSADALGSLVS